MNCSRCEVNPRAASHSYCPPCKRIYDKDWYSKNTVHRQQSMRRRHRADPRVMMLAAAKKRASAKGIEFLITRADLEVPFVCPVLGIIIEVNERRWQDSSPTIDRIDTRRGYVPGNVCVISARANRIKNDATADELERIAAYLRRRASS